ncbi:LLM class flavin-dependent oxidoreductase [Kribbella antiqua]|uniref:LLM class flavin-dependent oxidoreductase n=1 Tax=Kribbella antiqua TaxID=2512217 RepID=UPI0018EE5D2E
MYLPEHVVLYRGATFGGVEMPATLPYGDPLDMLAFVAAATERILLGTGVLLLPYHHPVYWRSGWRPSTYCRRVGCGC